MNTENTSCIGKVDEVKNKSSRKGNIRSLMRKEYVMLNFKAKENRSLMTGEKRLEC